MLYYTFSRENDPPAPTEGAKRETRLRGCAAEGGATDPGRGKTSPGRRASELPGRTEPKQRGPHDHTQRAEGPSGRSWLLEDRAHQD